MINNICESFNGWILEARVKSPVTMFEELRVKLMKRIAIRREKMAPYHGNICPKARDILEKNKMKAATYCIATFNGGDIAEVENIEGTKNVVNIARRTCTCRRWDLSGILCKHAISAVHLKRHDPDDYVAACYLKKTYMSIYDNLIQPVNNMDMWSRGEDHVIQPPQYSRQPSRPRTARMKAAYEKDKDDDTVIGKKRRVLRCGSCKQIGHNSKTCQRHLPHKEKIDFNLTIILMQSNQVKRPMTTNELRKKAKERNEYMRKRKADMKAQPAPKRARTGQAASTHQSSRPLQAGSAPSISRNVQGSNASTKKDGVTPRTSQRIRQSSAKGTGK
ncbi:hypothetical protein ACLB2K_060259 [Fragaria x ananassa]